MGIYYREFVQRLFILLVGIFSIIGSRTFNTAYAQTKTISSNNTDKCSIDGISIKLAAPVDPTNGTIQIIWNSKTKMLTRIKLPECKHEQLGKRTEFDERKEVEDQDGRKTAYTFTPDEASPNGTLFGICYNRTISVPRYECMGKEDREEYVNEHKWCWYSPQGELHELKSKYFRDEEYSSPQDVMLSSDGEWIGWLQGATLDTRFPKCTELGRQKYLTVQVKLLQPHTNESKLVPLPEALSTVVSERGGHVRILSIDGAAKEITMAFSKYAESDQIYTVNFDGKVVKEPAVTGINTSFGSLKHLKSGWIGLGQPVSKLKIKSDKQIAVWQFTAGKGKYEVGVLETMKCGRISRVSASPTGEYVAVQINFSGRCLNPISKNGVTHIIRVADNKNVLDLDGNLQTGPDVTFFNNYIVQGLKIIDLAAVR